MKDLKEVNFGGLEDYFGNPPIIGPWLYIQEGSRHYVGLIFKQVGSYPNESLHINLFAVDQFRHRELSRVVNSDEPPGKIGVFNASAPNTLHAFIPPASHLTEITPSLLQLLISSKTPRTVIFYIDDKRVPSVFHIGDNEIAVQNKDNGKCIYMTLRDDGNMELDNYYYFENIKTCPSIPHAVFFELLDFIAYETGCSTISLVDRSSKSIGTCMIPRDVMALAKNKTFYNRYGFDNLRFDTELKRLQSMLALEFLSERRPHAVDFFLTIKELHPDMTLKQLASKLVEWCGSSQYDETTYDSLMLSLTDIPSLDRHDNFTKNVGRHASCRIMHSFKGDFEDVEGAVEVGPSLKIYFTTSRSGGSRTRRRR
jgi:hypothetical protein